MNRRRGKTQWRKSNTRKIKTIDSLIEKLKPISPSNILNIKDDLKIIKEK